MMAHGIPRVLAWLAFGLGWLAGAAEPRFTHRAWNRDDGLPDNAAERLLLARDGWLWIGTRSGLARFDGLKFTVFDAQTPGFTGDAILDLAEDAAGSLWIATKQGLYRKRGGAFTKFTTADGLLHDYVNQILPAANGSVWFATKGGVNRLHDGKFSAFPFTETIYGPDLQRVQLFIVCGRRPAKVLPVCNRQSAATGRAAIFPGRCGTGLWLLAAGHTPNNGLRPELKPASHGPGKPAAAM